MGMREAVVAAAICVAALLRPAAAGGCVSRCCAVADDARNEDNQPRNVIDDHASNIDHRQTGQNRAEPGESISLQSFMAELVKCEIWLAGRYGDLANDSEIALEIQVKLIERFPYESYHLRFTFAMWAIAASARRPFGPAEPSIFVADPISEDPVPQERFTRHGALYEQGPQSGINVSGIIINYALIWAYAPPAASPFPYVYTILPGAKALKSITAECVRRVMAFAIRPVDESGVVTGFTVAKSPYPQALQRCVRIGMYASSDETVGRKTPEAILAIPTLPDSGLSFLPGANIIFHRFTPFYIAELVSSPGPYLERDLAQRWGFPVESSALHDAGYIIFKKFWEAKVASVWFPIVNIFVLI